MATNILEEGIIPRDSTLQGILSVQKSNLGVQRGLLLASGTPDAIILSGDATLIDKYYKGLVAAATDVATVNELFAKWWHINWGVTVGTDNAARQDLLKRWFGTVLDDERVHGVKFPLYSTSHLTTGELTDDSVGLTCVPSTEATANQDSFAHLAQFWCVEVSMERNEDGTHEIFAVEFIDDYDAVRSGEHLWQVLQKNTYVKRWNQDGYQYVKMRCHEAKGYHTWPQGTGGDGVVYPYMANPADYAGEDANGKITCGTDMAPVNYTSHNSGVAKWRNRGSQYAGAPGSLLVFQLTMIRLKYAVKGNSGTIEGCTSYNYQYTAAVSETGVERILLTTDQASHLLEGSNTIVGTKGTDDSHDRGVASMYSICKNKRIKSIESVTVDGTVYSAVNIDNGGVTFDTVAGETYLSTMPYWSGWNNNVQGYDGSRISPTSGKEPGRIQKTNFQNGSYLIVADELWQWGQDTDGNYTFDCYTCHDQSKVTTNGTISSDYTKCDDLTMTFPSDTAEGWKYIEDNAVPDDPAVLWPGKVSTEAGSGTGVKAAMYVQPHTSGVRAAWCVGHLYSSGGAGLPARISIRGTGSSNWDGSLGVPSGISG